MPAEHNDLIFEIRTWNFSHGVIAHWIGVLPFDRKIHRHLHFFSSQKHSSDPIVVLDSQNQLGSDFWSVLIVRWQRTWLICGRRIRRHRSRN